MMQPGGHNTPVPGDRLMDAGAPAVMQPGGHNTPVSGDRLMDTGAPFAFMDCGRPFDFMEIGKPFSFLKKKTGEKTPQAVVPLSEAVTRAEASLVCKVIGLNPRRGGLAVKPRRTARRPPHLGA